MEDKLANCKFTLLWIGESISLFATYLMILLAIHELKISMAQAALIPAAVFSPFLIFGFIFGAIVDKVNKRNILIWSNFIRFIIYLLIYFLLLLNFLSFYLLLLLLFISGAATVLFAIGYTSYMPEIFTEYNKLHKGNSDSILKIIGPALAGVIIVYTGYNGIILLNSAAFFVAFVVIMMIPKSNIEYLEPLSFSFKKIVNDIKEGEKHDLTKDLIDSLNLGLIVLVNSDYNKIMTDYHLVRQLEQTIYGH